MPVTPERELGERGLSEAMDRLGDRLGNSGWYLGPFTEVMFWITALKDVHGNAVDYTSPDGERLKALGWARNYAAHDLLTLAYTDRTSSGILGESILGRGLLGSGPRVVWVRDAVLPPRTDERGRRTLYQAHVADRGVLEPLQAAQAYLKGLP